MLTFNDKERDGQLESPLTMTILSPSLPLISDVCNTLKLEEEIDSLEDNEGSILGSNDHTTHLSQPEVSSQVINEARNQAPFYEINNTGMYLTLLHVSVHVCFYFCRYRNGRFWDWGYVIGITLPQ